jgi:hypothetical protein
MRYLPETLRASYEWVSSADEIDTLRAMTEADADAYAADAARNAAEHDVSDVTEADICALWRWLQR